MTINHLASGGLEHNVYFFILHFFLLLFFKRSICTFIIPYSTMKTYFRLSGFCKLSLNKFSLFFNHFFYWLTINAGSWSALLNVKGSCSSLWDSLGTSSIYYLVLPRDFLDQVLISRLIVLLMLRRLPGSYLPLPILRLPWINWSVPSVMFRLVTPPANSAEAAMCKLEMMIGDGAVATRLGAWAAGIADAGAVDWGAISGDGRGCITLGACIAGSAVTGAWTFLNFFLIFPDVPPAVTVPPFF